MSSLTIYFGNRLLNINNVSREDAEGMAENLSDPHPGRTTINVGPAGPVYIVNRSQIDYLEVKL